MGHSALWVFYFFECLLVKTLYFKPGLLHINEHLSPRQITSDDADQADQLPDKSVCISQFARVFKSGVCGDFLALVHRYQCV